MAVQINLLQNQKDYNRLDNYFRLLRLSVVVIGVVCFVTLIVVFSLKRNVQSSLADAISQQDELQQEINSLQDQEARIILINEKMAAMNDILEDTPDYSQIVETFLAFAPTASDSGTIDRISIDKETGEVVMSFPDVLSLSRFLGVIETEQFKENFQEIQIGSISLTGSNALTMSLDFTF